MTDIYYDSRKVRANGCFVAIRGVHADGHDFISDAVARGAKIIVSDHEVKLPSGVANMVVKDTAAELAKLSATMFGNPSGKARVIGITGTNGKTTATYLLEEIFKTAGYSPGVIGTVNWRYKDVVLNAPNTTPMSYDIQKLMGEMVSRGVSDIVLEVSSHAIDQQRVAEIDFDVAVFTNLTHEHLDYHKNLENYFAAKRRLFSELLPLSDKPRKTAIINWDDEYGKKILSGHLGDGVSVLKFGFKDGADVAVSHLESTIDGNKMGLKTPWGKLDCISPLKGRFNASNVMAAVATAGVLGVSLDKIKRGVESLACVPGRMEEVKVRDGISVLIDYAHTPDALQNVLSVLRGLASGRLITVFGCGGDRDKTKRAVMGEVASRASDVVIVTSDNPRSEDPDKIIEEIVSGISKTGLVREFFVDRDRRSAIKKAIDMAKKGDVVVIAGKGHEAFQVIGDKKIKFDDREVAKLCGCQ